MGLKLITAATGTPVSLEEVKQTIGIESSEWDSQLAGDIAAATELVAEHTGRIIGTETWELVIDAFAEEIVLPKGPVTSIAFVKYLDADRAEQTLDDGIYITDLVSDPQRLVRDPEESWPATADVPNAVTVRFVTGYATAPAAIKKAITTTVAAWYRNRESCELPAGVKAALEKYVSQWVFA